MANTMTRVLGIGSWDRSGSTILARVLGASPAVVSVGEINNLWDRGVDCDMQCGCGNSFSACEFWSAVMARAFPSDDELLEEAVEFSRGASNHSLLATWIWRKHPRGLDRYVQALDRLYGAIKEVSGAELIVDSSKTPWHLYAASRAVDQFSLVHLVRDPRGVVYSHKKVMEYEPGTDIAYMNRKGVGFTTAGWIYRNLIISGIWRSTRKRMVVSYEQFTSQPEEAAKKILAFSGLPNAVTPFETAPVITLGADHSVSGNPVRFQTGQVTVELDDEWKTRLDRDARLLVGGATAPFLASYRRAARAALERDSEQ